MTWTVKAKSVYSTGKLISESQFTYTFVKELELKFYMIVMLCIQTQKGVSENYQPVLLGVLMRKIYQSRKSKQNKGLEIIYK